MSSCSSDSIAMRLLEAVAQECRIMADDIAVLGGLVTSGAADAAALQSFDFLSQQASAQAALITQLIQVREGSHPGDFIALIDRIPLPRVRARLLSTLGGSVPHHHTNDDLVLWVDG